MAEIVFHHRTPALLVRWGNAFLEADVVDEENRIRVKATGRRINLGDITYFGETKLYIAIPCKDEGMLYKHAVELAEKYEVRYVLVSSIERVAGVRANDTKIITAILTWYI